MHNKDIWVNSCEKMQNRNNIVIANSSLIADFNSAKFRQT